MVASDWSVAKDAAYSSGSRPLSPPSDGNIGCYYNFKTTHKQEIFTSVDRNIEHCYWCSNETTEYFFKKFTRYFVYRKNKKSVEN